MLKKTEKQSTSHHNKVLTVLNAKGSMNQQYILYIRHNFEKNSNRSGRSPGDNKSHLCQRPLPEQTQLPKDITACVQFGKAI